MRYRGFQGVALGPIGFLVIINLIMFVVTLVRPELLYLLGLNPASFLSRPWTIATNLFVHGGFGHILTNMLALYFFGSYVIRLIGERNFWLAYFAGGVLGNILYILLGSPFSVAVGASGAIFALGGVLTVLRPKLTVFLIPIPVPIPLWVAVIGGFLILSFFPNVAWQAHLGGLVLGLGVGYYFRNRYVYY